MGRPDTPENPEPVPPGTRGGHRVEVRGVLGLGWLALGLGLVCWIVSFGVEIAAGRVGRVVALAGSSLAVLGVVALVGMWVVREVAAANQALRTQAEAILRSAELLERIAHALERPAQAPASPGADGRAHALAEIRRAIKAEEWELADELIRLFEEEHPDHPEGSRLADDLAHTRATVAEDLRARLAAAREAHDADRVLELHAALRSLLPAEALQTLDHDLVSWFLAVIQKRLRLIPIQTDVVILAGRVAEQFDSTKEGASLRASLPTLRRSVGLCPRCGEPYPGLDDACPKCLGTAPQAAPDTPAPGVPPTPLPPTLAPDPFEDEALSPHPSEELEEFRSFLDSPT